MNKFYPLTFNPIFKERIWGGNSLKTIFDKEFEGNQIGESWEISSLPEDTSIINNGDFKGKSLNEMLQIYADEILGKSIAEAYNNEFPLLIKLLDAQQDLSIQLHPNDDLAKKRHNSFGKTEMWYVIAAEKDSRIVVGFKENCNQKEYLEHLENKKLLKLLNEIPVKKGDIFMLETGTIHAIGAGIVIAEIQQTSDVTYRIYDWERVDNQGNSRELHTELALEAINYQTTNCAKKYSNNINELNKAVTSKYFTTSVLNLKNEFEFYTNEKLVILMCIEGEFEIEYDSQIYTYNKGTTTLIPAVLNHIKLKGNATILHITI